MAVIDKQTYTGGETWTKPTGAVLVKVVFSRTDTLEYLTYWFPADLLDNTEAIGFLSAPPNDTILFGGGSDAWVEFTGTTSNVECLVVTFGDDAHYTTLPQKGFPPPRGMKWLPRYHQDQFYPEPVADPPTPADEALRPQIQQRPVRLPVSAPRRQSVLWPEPALQDAVGAFHQDVLPTRLAVPSPRRQSVRWDEPDFDDALHAFDQPITPMRLAVPAPRRQSVLWTEPDLDDAVYAFDQIITPTRLPVPAPARQFVLWAEPQLADAIAAYHQDITPTRVPVPSPRWQSVRWAEPDTDDALYAFDQLIAPVRHPVPAPFRQSVLWAEPALQDAVYAFDQIVTPVKLPVPAPRREFSLWPEPDFFEAIRVYDQSIQPARPPLPTPRREYATWTDPDSVLAESPVFGFAGRGTPEYPHFRPWPRIVTTLWPVPIPDVPVLPEPEVPPREAAPILSADDDVAQAVFKRWHETAAIIAAVPGGLQRGRLTSFQPASTVRRAMPYAALTVSKSREGLANTGNFYLDFRMAVIEIRGSREQVEAAIPLIRDTFHEERLETQQAFLACILIDDAELTEDPDRRRGEDVWIGTIRLEVWTDRDQ